MTTIVENTSYVTVINVFTVHPSNQEKLIDILSRAAEASVCGLPGFVSAALHRSVDGTKVTMYSQWKSAEHYEQYRSALSDPVAAPYVHQALAIARLDPGVYDVVRVFAGSRGG